LLPRASTAAEAAPECRSRAPLPASLDRSEILLQRGEVHGAAQAALLTECAHLDGVDVSGVGDHSGNDRELGIRHADSVPEPRTVDRDFNSRWSDATR